NVERAINRAETDAVVADKFAELDEAEARERLVAADVAFASVNDMAGLSRHAHLRRIVVETPAGPVTYPAPAPIVIGEQRHYGAVPALGSAS
ncbi:MAG: CoA transferase, partial [Burkholderiales bacterium]